MPINPCGRAVDIGRRPYTTKARFFTDDLVEVDIWWYEAPLDRGTLGVPSLLHSLEWDSHPWLAAGVGEVYGAERTYKDPWEKTLPLEKHLCGTLPQVARGIEFDPNRNVCYDWQSLPFCCRGPMPPILPFNTWSTAYPWTFGVPILDGYQGAGLPGEEAWYRTGVLDVGQIYSVYLPGKVPSFRCDVIVFAEVGLLTQVPLGQYASDHPIALRFTMKVPNFHLTLRAINFDQYPPVTCPAFVSIQADVGDRKLPCKNPLHFDNLLASGDVCYLV